LNDFGGTFDNRLLVLVAGVCGSELLGQVGALVKRHGQLGQRCAEPYARLKHDGAIGRVVERSRTRTIKKTDESISTPCDFVRKLQQ
jgi:hypothetical protein